MSLFEHNLFINVPSRLRRVDNEFIYSVVKTQSLENRAFSRDFSFLSETQTAYALRDFLERQAVRFFIKTTAKQKKRTTQSYILELEYDQYLDDDKCGRKIGLTKREKVCIL